MAGNNTSSSLRDWEWFFQSLLDLLNDCNLFSVNNSVDEENIVMQLEHAIVALQQILPLVPGASECGIFL